MKISYINLGKSQLKVCWSVPPIIYCPSIELSYIALWKGHTSLSVKGALLLELLHLFASADSFRGFAYDQMQGVSYNKKFCGKPGFVNLPNNRTSQFMFPKCLIVYQNVKLVKSKFKSEKSNENKHKSNVVLKENEKNRHVC